MSSIDRRQLMAGAGLLGSALFTGGFHTAAHAQTSTIPVAVFGKLPDVNKVALSPAAKKIALVKQAAGENILVDYDMTTGASKAMRLGITKVREVFWIDDEHVAVVVSSTANFSVFSDSRTENNTVFVINMTKGTNITLFSEKNGADMADFNPVVMGGLGRITTSKGARITAANYRLRGNSANEFCLYSFDPATGKGNIIDSATLPVRNWIIKPDGALLARSEFRNLDKVWTLRIHDGKTWKAVYSETAPIDSPSLIGRGSSENTALVLFNSGERADKYYEIGVDGVFKGPLGPDGANVSPLFHPETRLLAGFVHADPAGETYEYSDPTLAKLPELIKKALPDYESRSIAARSFDPYKVIVYAEGASDPGTYCFFDFRSGAFRVVGETRPDLPSEWISEKKVIHYKAADGLEIEAFLTLPSTAALKGKPAKNLPLIVLPHGGPQASDSIGFDWWSQALASRGYVVLQPNFRGSDGYGQAFVEAGYGQWGRKMQTDLSDGVRHLAKEGLIDPSRVAITGASYGGYAAMAGITLDPGIYRCSVAVAGVSNLKSMLDWEHEQTGSKNSTTMLYWNRFMGNRDTLDDISPDMHVDKVTAPLLLIHGRDDTVVPFAQSLRMQSAMQKAGKPVEMFELPAEDHWLSREKTRVACLETMVAFLEKHNPPT